MEENGLSGEFGSLRLPMRESAPSVIVKATVKGVEYVEFCRHALDQMNVRGITIDEAIQAIRKPTRRIAQTQPGRTRVRKHRSSTEAVDVVYETFPDRLIVVTAIALTVPKRRRKVTFQRKPRPLGEMAKGVYDGVV